jgi:hypothetical protein
MIEFINLTLAWGVALFALFLITVLLFVNYTYARWMNELFKGDHV